MPSFAPKIRVEVYVPIRYEPAYQDTLSWLIDEFTDLRGGCTVNESVGGYYLSRSGEVIDDRVSIVLQRFPDGLGKPAGQSCFSESRKHMYIEIGNKQSAISCWWTLPERRDDLM